MTPEERYYRTLFQEMQNMKDKVNDLEKEIKSIKDQIEENNGSERQNHGVKK